MALFNSFWPKLEPKIGFTLCDSSFKIKIKNLKKLNRKKCRLRLEINGMIRSENARNEMDNVSIGDLKLRSTSSSYLDSKTKACDEYSDEILEEEEEEEDDCLPEADIKNLNKSLYVSIYAEKIFLNAKRDEKEEVSTCSFLSTQEEIKGEERADGIKWMMQISNQCCLSHDVLFLSIRLLDVVLCKKNIPLEELKYYILACLCISCKVDTKSSCILKLFNQEEYKNALVKYECEVFNLINFNVDYPTSRFYLLRLLIVLESDQLLMEASCFLIEVAALQVELLDFSPRVVSAAASLIALLSLGRESNVDKIMRYSHVEDIKELTLCANMLIVKAASSIESKDLIFERYTVEGMKINLSELNLSLNILNKL